MGCLPSRSEPIGSSKIPTKKLSSLNNQTQAKVPYKKKIVHHTINNIAINNTIFVTEKRTKFEDEYILMDLLGKGAYGEVYRGKHKSLDLERAIKIIDKNLMTQEEQIRSQREFDILKKLDHPNIMKMYEYFITSNKFYLICELCLGGELFDKIKEKGNLPEKQVAYIMRQIASAVCFCHSNNIIHRDLKPENILLESLDDKRSDEINIKVIDFGTSCFKTLTMIKEKAGTAFYIAPEVLDNFYNEKCDIWSLGVIMYILLCGEPPFADIDEDEIFIKIKKGEFSMTKPIWSKVSSQAKDLIGKMLQKDPKLRLSSEEVLSHEFFKLYTTQKSKQSTANLKVSLDKIAKHKPDKKLQQATLAFIVYNFPDNDEVRKYKRIFLDVDSNGDGRITKEELHQGLVSALGKEEADVLIDSIMSSLDNDNSGTIEYNEFIRACIDKSKILSDVNLRQAFRLFDSDNNEVITYDEVKQVLGQNAIDLKDEVWRKMVDEISSEGKISFEEFKAMMIELI